MIVAIASQPKLIRFMHATVPNITRQEPLLHKRVVNGKHKKALGCSMRVAKAVIRLVRLIESTNFQYGGRPVVARVLSGDPVAHPAFCAPFVLVGEGARQSETTSKVNSEWGVPTTFENGLMLTCGSC